MPTMPDYHGESSMERAEARRDDVRHPLAPRSRRERIDADPDAAMEHDREREDAEG